MKYLPAWIAVPKKEVIDVIDVLFPLVHRGAPPTIARLGRWLEMMEQMALHWLLSMFSQKVAQWQVGLDTYLNYGLPTISHS
jgi:hypothetical protein